MLQFGQCTASPETADEKNIELGGPVGLFEQVARLNGPLPDYHPQMLLQCLLWGE